MSNGSQSHSAPIVAAASLELSRGGRVVLRVDDLVIEPSITTLIGPNGSGKSTLLHAVAGLLEPTAGWVRTFGVEPSQARTRIAYVLQAQHSPSNLPVTVREIVRLGRAPERGAFRPLTASDRRIVEEAIERVALGPLADRHLAELSGGQRQRAFVAQGLAQRADLLLLDEPTAGLDAPSSEQIRQVLAEERAAGRTVVVATHDLAEAARSDQVVLLAGRLVASGPPAVALGRDHLVAAYGGRLLGIDGGTVLLDDGAHHHDHDHDDHHSGRSTPPSGHVAEG